ncbi:MAG: ABC-F family ATP-binding cassette domain-containing protein, partial [Treponema sp.]|nr:ABC-F family ATP-binding cassette domain-containing protein [Treponema sp.]
MAFAQFSGISLAFGDRDILKDASLRLASGSRCCLTGANGSGKTTLMKIIAGEIKSDSGERALQKGTRVSYLPQSGIVHHGKTLREEAETAFSFAHNLIARMEEIGGKLGDSVEKENSRSSSGSMQTLLEEHHNLQEQIENSGYYRREADVSMVLSGLGFSAQDMNRNTDEFSGGWQMRIALAKILLEKPDILLLDEPTNYLDIEARAWLENWLNTFTGGYLLVSHDRYFLDMCVNEVYEIFNGSLKRYTGNYSAYEKIRKVELESLVKRYWEQQEEIEKTEALIRRFRYKASKAAFAQDLVKRLEKMERVEIPESLKKLNITFPPAPHSGKVALTLEGIGKSYGQRQVLSKLDLNIDANERLVVAGPNGAGKTTLLRIIAGADSDFSGSVKFGSGISAGYFSQESSVNKSTVMDENKNIQVIEYLEDGAPTALIPKLRDMLGAFLFRGDDVYKSVSVLSGGEKSRLALLKMLLKPLNLLILDEPTNHLDLHSKDILLDALAKFKGTIIFVSHDRYFMEALSTKTLELSASQGTNPPKARLFYGNYAYYLERTAEEKTGTKVQSTMKKPEPQKSANEAHAINKQKQAAIRKQKKQEEEILNLIEKLEKEKAALETELELPEVYSYAEKARAVKMKIDEHTAEIEAKT